MLNRIIEFSLRNRMLVMIAGVVLLVAGTYTARKMEVDVFPDLNAPTVVVMTEASGMAAEEVERTVTFPIETAVNGATDVRRVRSSSTSGFSVVWVEFDWGTDIYLARQIVSEKLAALNETLPNNVGTPTLGPQSSILGELMIIGLTSDSTSLEELRTLADWTIRPRLLSTGGVAQVTVIGGDIKEYQILLDPARMKHFGVTTGEVLGVVENLTRNSSGGILNQHGNEYIIRGMLSTADEDEMGRAVIRIENGLPITLEQVADVRIGAKTPRLGTASERGKPAVLMTVTKQPNTNSLELTEKLDRAVAELSETLPADVHVSTDSFRQARFIEGSIDNIQKSLFEGAVFVVIVLLVFLMNFRTTVISLVALPLSLLVSILALKWMGLTINTMSLGGMARRRRDHRRRERIQKAAREFRAPQGPAAADAEHRFRGVERDPYVGRPRDDHHDRGLRPAFLPRRHGRAHAAPAGHLVHRSAVRIDDRGGHADARAVQLLADRRPGTPPQRKGTRRLALSEARLPPRARMGARP